MPDTQVYATSAGIPTIGFLAVQFELWRTSRARKQIQGEGVPALA
jgi:hypothetical protein